MAQPVPAAVRVSLSADDQRRDDEAWNLPRRSVETGGRATARDGLDWHEFVDAYFPGSRRHNLEAVASYGAYRRRTGVADDQNSRLQ
jgi:hypothetical protein